MPFFDFIWLDAVLDKLAEREISAEEIEAIISHAEFADVSRSSGLPVAFGHLIDGRFVVVYRWGDQITVQPNYERCGDRGCRAGRTPVVAGASPGR